MYSSRVVETTNISYLRWLTSTGQEDKKAYWNLNMVLFIFPFLFITNMLIYSALSFKRMFVLKPLINLYSQ